MPENKRPSFARVQYRAVQPLVEQKLAEGYSIRLIYEELTGSGSLTMGYTSFCDYIRGKGVRQHGRKKPDPKQAPHLNKALPPSGSPPNRPGRIDKSEPFSIVRRSLEELV